jgi:hypothetical protein
MQLLAIRTEIWPQKVQFRISGSPCSLFGASVGRDYTALIRHCLIGLAVNKMTIYRLGRDYKLDSIEWVYYILYSDPPVQPRSQALPSCGANTLVDAGHMTHRKW